jgi:LysM repeat protein
MEWKTTNSPDDDMLEEHYTTLKDGSSGIFGERSRLPLMIILAGIIFLVALFFLVNPRPPETVQADTDVIDTRLALLEQQTNEIDGLREKIKSLDARLQQEGLSAMEVDRLTDAIQANAGAISQLGQKISQLEAEIQKTVEQLKALPAAGASARPATAAATSTASPAAAQSGKGHVYHSVQKGDTLYQLSVKYGVSVPRIQELNNMGKKTDIFPGTRLVVGPANP